MNSLSALNAYKSHDLNIMMKTSSGDVIKLDFSNEKSLSYANEKNENSSKSVLKFSSMESFKFSIDSNGIDEQDKKEIEKFLEIAKPYIDNFLEELKEDDKNSTPLNKTAQNIVDSLYSLTDKSQNTKNYAKNSLVDMFDKAIHLNKTIEKQFDKMFEEAKKLLEKTLQLFDNPNKSVYA